MPLFGKTLVLLLLLPALAGGEEIVINAVGDIMLTGSGRRTYSREGYAYPFAATAGILKDGDITVGNLEAPLSNRGEEFREKRYRFRASPEAAFALREAGFSVLTLANNHILDYGIQGLTDTLHHLDREGLLHTGAGETLHEARREAVIVVKGKRVAFLSYSLTLPAEFFAAVNRAGTAPGYLPYYAQDITAVRARADYVVVSFHWGHEMADFPKVSQISTAHRAIDAGADLVLGHHPHVLQGVERYKNGVILYSLGNFTFGSLSSGSAHSAIARITLDRGVKNVELIPLNVLNREVRFQPRPLTGKARQEVIDHVTRISAAWGTGAVEAGGRNILEFRESARD